MAELAELSTSKTQWRGGRLLHIHVAPAASVKMVELAEANFVAGRGIEGDRYFLESLIESFIELMSQVFMLPIFHRRTSC